MKPSRTGTVGDLRMGHQVLGGADDLGHTGLVVRAEQRRAGGRDDVVADLFVQRRVVVETDHGRGVVGQHESWP